MQVAVYLDEMLSLEIFSPAREVLLLMQPEKSLNQKSKRY
jgi:hypothetical protein